MGAAETETDLDKELLSFLQQIITHLQEKGTFTGLDDDQVKSNNQLK